MNNNMINENPAVKYRVVLNGQVLNEVPSKMLAEQFIMSLSEEQRAKAQVVPITEGGHQILFG